MLKKLSILVATLVGLQAASSPVISLGYLTNISTIIDAPVIGLVASTSYNATTASNNVTMLQNFMLNNTNRIVRLSGIYHFNAEIDVTNNNSLLGSNPATDQLNFNNAETTTNTITNAFVFISGSQTALPTIASNILANDTTIQFASSPDLAAGDVYLLWNAITNSFSLDRAAYYAGEFHTVVGVGGSTVTNSSPSMAAYTVGTNILAYKQNLTTSFVRNLSIRAKDDISKDALRFDHATGLLFDNLDINGSQLAQIELIQCYNVKGGNITGTDFSSASGNNYGLSVANCQVGEFYNISFWGPRHGTTLGGYSTPGSVPNRWIKYFNVHTEAYGSSGNTGIDCHGNAEYIEWHNCSSPSGIDIGGDHLKVVGGTFGNYNDNFEALLIKGTTGMDFEINDVSLYANQELRTATALGYILTQASMTKENQVGRINNMKIDLGAFTGDGASTFGLTFENNVFTTNQNYSFEVNNLSVTSSYTNNIGTNFIHIYGLNFAPGNTAGFKSAKIDGGTFINCGVRYRANIQNLELNNLTILNPVGDSILAVAVATPTITDQKINLKNIYAIGAQGTMNLPGNMYQKIWITDVKSYNNANHLNVDSSFDGSIYLTGYDDVYAYNNYFGDLRVSPTQVRAWTLTDINNLHWNNNIKVGTVTAVTETGITNTITELAPQTDSSYVYWNKSSKTIGIGTVNTTYANPIVIRRDTNALVQFSLQNLNGTVLSGAGLGIFSGTASAVFGVANAGYTPFPALDDAAFIQLNSTAGKGVFYGETAGQTWNFYAGSSTRALQVATTNMTLAGVETAHSIVATNGLSIKEATNLRMGTAVLVGGTVVVNNTSVTANTRIFLSRTTTGGTTGDLSSTISAGTSFTINSSSGADTSSIVWLLIEAI